MQLTETARRIDMLLLLYACCTYACGLTMQDSFARLNEGHVYKTIAHTVCNDKSTGVGRSLSA